MRAVGPEVSNIQPLKRCPGHILPGELHHPAGQVDADHLEPRVHQLPRSRQPGATTQIQHPRPAGQRPDQPLSRGQLPLLVRKRLVIAVTDRVKRLGLPLTVEPHALSTGLAALVFRLDESLAHQLHLFMCIHSIVSAIPAYHPRRPASHRPRRTNTTGTPNDTGESTTAPELPPPPAHTRLTRKRPRTQSPEPSRTPLRSQATAHRVHTESPLPDANRRPSLDNFDQPDAPTYRLHTAVEGARARRVTGDRGRALSSMSDADVRQIEARCSPRGSRSRPA